MREAIQKKKKEINNKCMGDKDRLMKQVEKNNQIEKSLRF